MQPIEIVFKEYYLKYELLPFIITIFMVILVIVITIIFVIKEIRRSGL